MTFPGKIETYRESLELVGLSARGGSYPVQLSGLQQLRVSIARAPKAGLTAKDALSSEDINSTAAQTYANIIAVCDGDQ